MEDLEKLLMWMAARARSDDTNTTEKAPRNARSGGPHTTEKVPKNSAVSSGSAHFPVASAFMRIMYLF
jgi:hypothetical protein